jgi:hypothetical protein
MMFFRRWLMTASAASSLQLRSPRTAILVIHGIGEQDPYEPLDSFARGLFSHFKQRWPGVLLNPIQIGHKDWTQVGMRIEFPESTSPLNGGSGSKWFIDLFEYYWAPATEGKRTAVETVKWVLKTDFTPLRYFVDDLQQELGSASESGIKPGMALKRVTQVWLREVMRVVCLYLPLAVLFSFVLSRLLSFSSYARSAAKVLTAVQAAWGWQGQRGLSQLAHLLPSVLTLFINAVLLLMVWFALQTYFEWRRHPGDAIDNRADRWWFKANLASIAALLIPAVYFNLFRYRASFAAVFEVILRPANLAALASLALLVLLSYVLTAYVADIAVYTNMDAKSKDYEVHNKILEGSTEALKLLLKNSDYDRVLLAGHSLGSVIAYDTINELLLECSSAPAAGSDKDERINCAELRKLKGMATFGSPLDKIYYFFREHVKRDQAIRAQVLSLLHSFRKCQSHRDYGQFKFTYKLDCLDRDGEFTWINAWAKKDYISAKLKFYRLEDDNQREFPYRIPGAAHLSYWGDPAFYDFFSAKLLLAPGTGGSSPAAQMAGVGSQAAQKT